MIWNVIKIHIYKNKEQILVIEHYHVNEYIKNFLNDTPVIDTILFFSFSQSIYHSILSSLDLVHTSLFFNPAKSSFLLLSIIILPLQHHPINNGHLPFPLLTLLLFHLLLSLPPLIPLFLLYQLTFLLPFFHELSQHSYLFFIVLLEVKPVFFPHAD